MLLRTFQGPVERAATFTWERCAAQVEAIWDELDG